MDRRTFLSRPASRYASARRRDIEAELYPIDSAAPLRTEHAGALGVRAAQHLLRRTVFGGNSRMVADYASLTADSAVEQLFLQDPATDWGFPDWAHVPRPPGNPRDVFRAYKAANRQAFKEVREGFTERLAYGSMRERMTLFWLNHFVAVARDASHTIRYLDLLQRNALGDMKVLIREVGKQPAMMTYLDLHKSHKKKPNENFARELLELFTMGQIGPGGQANYSQEDIITIARAFTGWVIDKEAFAASFRPKRHDASPKTLWGHTFNEGEGDFDKVIDIILEERAFEIAHFTARELYQEFVYHAPNPSVVDDLAGILYEDDLHIERALKTLLKSAHFFQSEVRGTRIKSPAEHMIALTREYGGTVDSKRLWSWTKNAGQNVIAPPNVSGWDGHRSWLNTDTLARRWEGGRKNFDWGSKISVLSWVEAVRAIDPELPSVEDPEFPFKAPARILEIALTVPLGQLDVPEQDNAEFVGDITAHPPPAYVTGVTADLAKIFMGKYPWYKWQSYRLQRRRKILKGFFRFVRELPEFQLT